MSNTLGDLFNMCRIIILGKIKAMFRKIYYRNVNAIVLVLPNGFIVSYEIAKCIREITKGKYEVPLF